MTINIKASKDLNVFNTGEKRLYPNSENWPIIYRNLKEQGYRMCYGILAVDSKVDAAVGYQIILRNDNRNRYLIWLDPNHHLSKLVRMKMIKATKEYFKSQKRYHMNLKMILLEDETESKRACQEIISIYEELHVSVSAQGMRKKVNCFQRPTQEEQMYYEVTSSVFDLRMLGFQKLYHATDNKIADATILLNVRKDPKERYQVAGYANIKKWHSYIVLKELVLHETRKKDRLAFLKDGVNLYKRDVLALVPEGQYENISVFEEAGFKRACIEFTLTF